MTADISYTMTWRELVRAVCARHKFQYSLPWRAAHVIMGLPLTIGCLRWIIRIFEIEYAENITPMFLAVYGIGLVLGLVLLLYKYIGVLAQLLQARKTGLFGKQFTYLVSEEGVYGEPFGTEFTLAWQTFQDSGVTKRGIILCLSNNTFHWLPRAAFESDETWRKITEVANKRMPKKELF